MSAPVVERPRRAGRPARTAPAIPAQRGGGSPQGAGQRTNAQKAYAKKEERLRRLVGGVRPARGGTPRRAQFVLLVMALLGTGLVLTLWLSTAASADSYRLQDARAAAGSLGERSEQLRREVAVAGSAPEIARRAGEMGMVPVQDPARVVVAVDGSVVVVGEPQVAQAPAPPVVAVPAPDDEPAAEDAPVDGSPTDEAPADQAPVEEEQIDGAPADESAADENAADEVLADSAGATSDQAAGAEPATAPN